MDDLISRKAAIDTIVTDMVAAGWDTMKAYEEGKHGKNAYLEGISDLLAVLRDLPSVQPERPKKGHWVKVGGYVTPGGDPVWQCSECGKGQHVWGVEAASYGAGVADHQWVSCPNCGARMDEA